MATSRINRHFVATIGNNVSISSMTLANNSFTTVATFSVPENGIYILTTDMVFAAGNGIRILLVDTAETQNNGAVNSVLVEGRATIQKTRFFRLTTNDSVYIRAFQNSGSDMSVNGNYRLMKVAD